MGLAEKVKSYFFAPKDGWIYNADPAVPWKLTAEQIGMLQMEAFAPCASNGTPLCLKGSRVRQIPFVADRNLLLALNFIAYNTRYKMQLPYSS